MSSQRFTALWGPPSRSRSRRCPQPARSVTMFDVAVVGGGPAGLAVAIETARRGLSVVVAERHLTPPDKACGEGIMPPGVRALEKMGIRKRLASSECTSFESVRYIDQDGLSAKGRLAGEGLAVRRIALVTAMSDAARDVGVDLRHGCKVASCLRRPGEMRLQTDRGVLSARMVVAADGLASRLRHAEGLDVPCTGPRRFGLRQHFVCAPWSTSIRGSPRPRCGGIRDPVSDRCVGVAFLWTEPLGNERSPADERSATRWRRLAARFPCLMDSLGDAPPESPIRGAGPFERASRKLAPPADLLLWADAAGYVDAITGEGISLFILSALSLAGTIPDALAHGAHRAALQPYEDEHRRVFRRYALTTRALLAIIRRPRLRRSSLLLLRRAPALFDFLLARCSI